MEELEGEESLKIMECEAGRYKGTRSCFCFGSVTMQGWLRKGLNKGYVCLLALVNDLGFQEGGGTC